MVKLINTCNVCVIASQNVFSGLQAYNQVNLYDFHTIYLIRPNESRRQVGCRLLKLDEADRTALDLEIITRLPVLGGEHMLSAQQCRYV